MYTIEEETIMPLGILDILGILGTSLLVSDRSANMGVQLGHLIPAITQDDFRETLLITNRGRGDDITYVDVWVTTISNSVVICLQMCHKIMSHVGLVSTSH